MRQIDDNASENAVSMLVANKVFYKFRLIFKRNPLMAVKEEPLPISLASHFCKLVLKLEKI
jgi:hypothetical protein